MSARDGESRDAGSREGPLQEKRRRGPAVHFHDLGTAPGPFLNFSLLASSSPSIPLGVSRGVTLKLSPVLQALLLLQEPGSSIQPWTLVRILFQHLLVSKQFPGRKQRCRTIQPNLGRNGVQESEENGQEPPASATPTEPAPPHAHANLDVKIKDS